jgi:hypothetical protein
MATLTVRHAREATLRGLVGWITVALGGVTLLKLF